MAFNLPTWLTLIRIAMVPVVAALLCLQFHIADELGAAIFCLAVITDWFDGWLARRWQQESDFGAFLDPVADKLIVCTVLVLLVYRNPTLLVALPAVVVVGRELTVSALRELMAEKGARSAVAVGASGKYKTTAQMVAIVMLVLFSGARGPLYDLGLALLWLAAALTIWSMLQYLRAAWPRLDGSTSGHG